ncbi:MAG: 4-(cytidine 5'-diphospho)-2-C-methyl-D-erythritol kinase [Nitrospiria bacterium]
MKQQLSLQAPAKINLYLRVLNQRSDGFHNLSSLMHMVGLYDRLTFEAQETDLTLAISGNPLPSDASNLVLKAATLLQKEMIDEGYPRKGAHITLHKTIPVSAGLAGGSSDAAATLVGLNRLWSLFWPKQKLARLGAVLGSDVPFFFDGPAAWISGRGEKVTPVSDNIQGWVVLVHPEIPVSTAAVFRAYASRAGLTKQGSPLNIKPEKLRPSETEILAHPLNDLESVTLTRFPLLNAVKQTLRDLGGVFVLMSGSGPTLFALFGHQEEAEKTARQMPKVMRGTALKAWAVPLLWTSPFEEIF